MTRPAVQTPLFTAATAPLTGRDEFELLCELAGADLTPERREFIAHRKTPLDSKEFLHLAEHHGVLPLVAHNLIDDGRDVSAQNKAVWPSSEFDRSLRSAYEANLRRSLSFTAELTRIIEHFERSKLRAIPYKGPVLAQSAYGDVGLRSFFDLDFLIAPADFDRAKRALAEIRYRPSADLSPALERLWLRIGYERMFDGPAGKNFVELQWALLPQFYAIDFGVEGLLKRAGRAVIAAREVPCLSAEDSLLVVSLHAAKHLWARLIWLADIAASLRCPRLDCAAALKRARELGILRILGVSFWLVKNVLRATLPQPAEELISTDARLAILGREFAARLARGAAYDFESTEYFRLIWKLRERPTDRWKYLWRLASTPSAGDIAVMRLPEALFPLYRIVRFARLPRFAALRR